MTHEPATYRRALFITCIGIIIFCRSRDRGTCETLPRSNRSPIAALQSLKHKERLDRLTPQRCLVAIQAFEYVLVQVDEPHKALCDFLLDVARFPRASSSSYCLAMSRGIEMIFASD